MLLNLNLTTWARRMAANWFGLRRVKKAKRQTRTRLSSQFESLELREMLTAYTVTTLNDIVNGADGVTSLREAVLAANQNPGADAIQFASGLVGEISLTGGQIPITDSVSITGNGADSSIINAQGDSRIFYLTDNALDVTFQGLTLTGGYASGEGGAIGNYVEQTNSLNVWDSVVTGNAATSLGGAIYIYDFTSLDIRNSQFTWNSTTFDDSIGGAITAYNGGTLTLTNSTFARNETFGDRAHGGAIYWYSGAVTATGTTFSANYTSGANAHGGAIILEVGQLALNGSLFENNQTVGDDSPGGALYLGREVNANISGTEFLQNRTIGERSDGGAIYGEAILVSGVGEVAIEESRFTGNLVEGPGAKGGAIALEAGVLSITHSIIQDNQANGPVDFASSTFGGGVYMEQGTATIHSSTLSNNSTTGYGGGVYQVSGRLNVINSTISGNSATTANYSWGGGISVYSAEVAIDSSTIAYNTVAGEFASGGGVMFLLGTAQIRNSIIAQNVAANAPDLSGGGVGASALPGEFMNTAFVPPLTVLNSLIGNQHGTDLTASATPDANGNVIGTAAAPIDPLLQALTLNGGGIPTHAIGVNSPAWNRGNNLYAQALGLTADEARQPRIVAGIIDLGAFEVQGPSLYGMFLTPGQPNPTSATSVSFEILFSETVTGVTASQFMPVVTGETQAGHVTVVQVVNDRYRATVHDVSGPGTLALKFQSNGQIVSTATTIPIENGFSQDSYESYTIEEVASLSVLSIVYGPGNTSPTTFDTVTFTVTFSAAVQNVAASQFSVVTTGGVTSNGPQLTGSGAVYTVTVSGINGAGTLGLNFANDGTVVRVSDGQVMTEPNFAGAVFEVVEGTQGEADLDVGGLRFHVVGGGTFTTLGELHTASGQVQVGFTPGQGQAFTPLAELNGNVSVRTDNLSFSVTGAVKAIIGSTAYTLYTGGLTDISVTDLLNAGISKVGESLGVAGVSFSLGSMGFVNSPQPAIRLQGSLTLPLGIKVAVEEVNSVQIDSDGISINGASFSLTNSFSVGSVEFSTDNLTAYYSSNGNVFRLTGAASVEIGDIANLTVNFSDTGLVINDGEFSSIDVTVTGEFDVKGVKVSATDLRFRYDGDTEKFSLSGTAEIEIEGFDAEFSVTFGSETTSGIEITNGELDSLDLTVNGEIEVSKVTINADDLRITYTENSFTMSGGATVEVEGLGELGVTFGDEDTPGMVVEDGVLQRLSMTINAEFEVSKVKVFANDLTFTYERTMSGAASFSLSGTAGILVEGIDGEGDGNQFSVTFGYQGAPGIVVEEGELKSLDITINATFEVAKVSIKANNLRFTYDAETSSFSLSGSASVFINGIQGDTPQGISVKFGENGQPGIEVIEGELTRLDVTINATIKVSGVSIEAKNVRLTYDSNSFTLGGEALVEVSGFKIGIAFGYTDENNVPHPGIVIEDGRLTTLDMSVTAGFSVFGLQINVEKLRFSYREISPGLYRFGLSGGVSLSPQGMGDKLSILASLGDGQAREGIVINSNGQLVSLNFTLHGKVDVKAVSLSGELKLDYTHATKKIVISGTAKVAIAGVGEALTVKLGDGTKEGLVIQNGVLTNFDMTISTNLAFTGVTLNGSLAMTYSSQAGEFVASGTVKLNVTGITGEITATLGGNGTRGLVIKNGALQSLDMSATANFSVGPLALNGALTLSYSHAQRRFLMYGSANGSFLGQNFLNINLGDSSSPGVYIDNGRLQSFRVQINGGFNILGVGLGINATAYYNSSGFYFQGFAGVTLPSSIPDWLATALGGYGRQIGLQIIMDVRAGDSANSYLQAMAYIPGGPYGFRISFNNQMTFYGNPINFLVGGRRSGQYGPLEDATVYYDPNYSFDLENSSQTTTGPDGSFADIVSGDETIGQLVLEGGVDQSTGILNSMRLTAPAESLVISPLTSLVNQLMQQEGVSSRDAIFMVNGALGIPLNTSLMGQTLYLEATGGDAQSAQSFSREVAVAILVHEISSLLSELPGAQGMKELSTSGFAVLAEVVGESTGAPLDLSDPLVVREILDRTAALAGLTLDDVLAETAVAVMADLSQRIDDLPLDGIQSYLNGLLQIQTVGQGAIAPDLARLAANEITPTLFAELYSGAALTTRINEASYGPLNVIGPVITMTPAISQAVGAGQPATFDFQVFLSSSTPSLVPVTVHYATSHLDGAVAGVDFEAIAGTLTWLPGDVTPKTISVPVYATMSEVQNRTFTVELSEALNAELGTTIAVGQIASSQFATNLTVSASDTTVSYGEEVTFTTVITALDPAQTVLNHGSILFYSGEELLAHVDVDDGLARFTTSTLSAGTNHIRAVYTGAMFDTRSYLPSESSALHEVVAQVDQTISFPTLVDATVGDAPLLLQAISTSGLPISYRLVSGPGSLNGEVLALTGPGTIVIEATQSGDGNYRSATPVSRTLTIHDSATGSSNTAPDTFHATLHVDPGETLVGQLLATDVDDDELTFGIIIEPEYGVVVLLENGQFEYTAGADFEGVDSFVFVASDGQLSSMSTITIIVGDPNLPPVVNAATLSLAENSTFGTTVGTVMASDPNPGQTQTFSIIGGNLDGAFAIDPSSGLITVANPALLDFETTPNYALLIEVIDDGDPAQSATGTITINLTDINEAPEVVSASFSLDENSALNTQVGVVSASDPDANQTRTFSIMGGNTGNAFAIHPSTGVISVASPSALNFEITDLFELLIKVTDNGAPSESGEATITIHLNNVNEAPVVQPVTFSIAENSQGGTTVGTASATDVDRSQARLFSIISGNTSGAFAIDPVSGVITVANSTALNFEATPTFSLTVQATDDGIPAQSGTATVTIHLTNEADEPILASGSGTVTYQKKQQPVAVMSAVTVQSFIGSASLGRIVISVFVPKKGQLSDYSFGNASSLGTVASSGATEFRKAGGTHTITVTLNAGVTDLQVQNYLRSITFSSKKMDPAKKPLGRKLDVRVFDREGAGTPSNLLTTQIVAQKAKKNLPVQV